MGKQTTNGSQTSRIVWDNLEEWVRRKVQEFIQSLLEEEVTELLGREKSERRQAVDSLPVYRTWQGAAADLGLRDGHRSPTQGAGIGATV
jgi:transposase-like protein